MQSLPDRSKNLSELQRNLPKLMKVAEAAREGFRNQRIGYSSAIAIVFFLIVVSVSLVQRRLTRDKD